MCARFSAMADGEVLADAFDLEAAPPLEPRPNVAPGQLVAVVKARQAGAKRPVAIARWGLVPGRATGARSRPHVNARAETAADLPAFQEAFGLRRGLVPADSFYEWAQGGARRAPYRVRRRDSRLLALGALWEPGIGGGPPTCVILTTAANAVVGALHDRMPLVIPADRYDRWLDPRSSTSDLRGLVAPHPAEEMTAEPAPPWINDPRNQGPPELPLFRPSG